MTDSLLIYDRVIKSFGGIKAVNNTSFSIPEGKIVSLIGPNGAGKTTTFNCITGMYSPDSGQVRFKDKILNHLAPHEIARLGIARTFQNLQIFTNMTLLENVLVPMKETRNISAIGSMLRLPHLKKKENEVKEYGLKNLQLVGLEEKAYQPANQLSFGEQRRLEIARSLSLEPKLLLLDEPMSGLSKEEVQQMKMLICQLKEQGITILLIEHDLTTVMEISDHIIVLEFGTKIAEGTPDEITRDERVIEAYLGKDVKKKYKTRTLPKEAQTMLLVKNLHVYHNNIHALKNVSLEVKEGELVTIIGTNGAGKTTLLSTIANLKSPRSGEIIFCNKTIIKTQAEQLPSHGIVLVPERRGMFAELTVEESLWLGAYHRFKKQPFKQRNKATVVEEMEQMYDFFPRLKERRKQLAGTLSGGEQQMLAIARGLMSNPQLLMLDEPSLGLAPLIIEEIFDKLYELKMKGITILLVEQNAKVALQISDRAYVFENGTMKMTGVAHELMNNEDVVNAYLRAY